MPVPLSVQNLGMLSGQLLYCEYRPGRWVGSVWDAGARGGGVQDLLSLVASTKIPGANIGIFAYSLWTQRNTSHLLQALRER